jgi:hypothetical protein
VTWAFDDIEDLASFLLREAGIPKPPVDVERLALALGVDEIVTCTLSREDGRLELRGSSALIFVSRDMSPARRRFTIAHEIGHLVLADPSLDLIAIRMKTDALRSDERFCDRFAETLLMPAAWISERYGELPQSLSTLLKCTEAFGVSAAAATVRLQRVLGWSRALLRFELCRAEWTLFSVTAWRPEPRASVQATGATRAVLDQLALPGSVSRLWLPLRAADADWLVGAELWGRSGWALALVDTSRRHAPRSQPLAPAGLTDLAKSLKLFYSLDDIDACILSQPSKREGSDEQCDHGEKTARLAAA